MTTFFAADHHFGHAGILHMCRRPFATIEEHDEALVEAWNAVVTDRDTVWYLGDFAIGASPERCASLFRRLRGTKHLVRGNHDKPRVVDLGWNEVHDLVSRRIEGQRVILCHYPMRAWSGTWRGSLHLFGHTHGSLPDTSQSADVGVDRWSYRPVTLDEIRERLAATPDLPEERARGATAAADGE